MSYPVTPSPSRLNSSLGLPTLMPTPPHRSHVLLIEDDHPAVPELLVRVLTGAGFEVTVTRLPAVVPDQVGLVILDAGPSGVDLKSRLAAIRGRWPSVPVLVLLASAEADTLLAIAADGRARAMEKPFAPRELLRAVQVMLDRHERTEVTS